MFTAEEEAILAESVDLDGETRQRVLLLYRSLEQATHYQLLGVERSADRKALKRAYFELASKLHPDKYFRKRLGSFKQRMETIFSRITQAHDTLGNSQKRAEYDAYLEEKSRSRSIEELLDDALAEVRRAEAKADQEAQEAEARAAPSGSIAAAAPAPVSPSQPAIPAAAPVPVVDVAIAARRDALAQRLLGGRPRPSPSGPQTALSPAAASARTSDPARAPVVPPRPSASDAMATLRRRYEERRTMAKTAQARKYLARGQEALAAGDNVAAASALRVAVSLQPDDPELARLAKETQAKADEVMAATYEKQAVYEERNTQWPEAARSWARVCRVRPGDKNAHERAANAIVKAGGDLHEAGRLAQRACSLDPDNVPFRITLANVYLAAGLTLNARRELETAAQVAPQDGTIQAMLKRVGKPA